MHSVAILGAGELGGALARQLAAADIASRIVIVDARAGVAAGKALDILQAAPVDGYSTHLTGTSDESAVVSADAVVLADRAEDQREWQGDAGVGLVRRVGGLNPRGIILCAGAAQLELVDRGVREGGIARQRLFGSAPEALRAAVMSMAALEAGCTPAEISLSVLGRPPHEIIVPWEDASMGGRRASEVLPPPALTRLDARLPRLWPPGPMTLAAAATRVLASAAHRDHLTVHAFVTVAREDGAPQGAGMLPVRVGPRGIAAELSPSLSARDRVRLQTAFHR